MARILTGVQSTGTPHLGNILGAILPAIKMSNDSKNDSFLFIADLHSLTQIKNAEILRQNTLSTAATWLAFGLDIIKKSGSWFSYDETKLGQGRDAVKQMINDNPDLMDELEEKIKVAIKGSAE